MRAEILKIWSWKGGRERKKKTAYWREGWQEKGEGKGPGSSKMKWWHEATLPIMTVGNQVFLELRSLDLSLGKSVFKEHTQLLSVFCSCSNTALTLDPFILLCYTCDYFGSLSIPSWGQVSRTPGSFLEWPLVGSHMGALPSWLDQSVGVVWGWLVTHQVWILPTLGCAH